MITKLAWSFYHDTLIHHNYSLVWCFLQSPVGDGGSSVGGVVTSCLTQQYFWQTDVASYKKNHTYKKSNQSSLINQIKKVWSEFKGKYFVDIDKLDIIIKIYILGFEYNF